MGPELNVFVNTIKVIFLIFYLSFVNLNAISFFGRDSCAKILVLSQLLIFLVLFYPRLELVYVSLHVLLSPCLLVALKLVSKCY